MQRIFIPAIILFSSCDCVQRTSGIVLDKDSGEPLEDVGFGKYRRENKGNAYTTKQYSDSLGRFNYVSDLGGLFRCPDLSLYFTKDGYIPERREYGCPDCAETDTVYLRRYPDRKK